MRILSLRSTQPTRSPHHRPVASPVLHELLVRSCLTDGASVQEEDVVSPLHQAETLGDEKHRPGAPLGTLIEELLHLRKDMDSVRAGDHSQPRGTSAFPEPGQTSPGSPPFVQTTPWDGGPRRLSSKHFSVKSLIC